MIPFRIGARDRRILVVGVVVISFLVGTARGVPLARAWAARERAEAELVAASIARSRDGARRLPLLLDSLRARRARLEALDSSLIVGQTAASAAASLAAKIEDVADQSLVRISGLQIRADTGSATGLARVGIRLTASTDVQGLASFLRAVEGDQTPLVVREITIAQPEPAAADTKPESLRIEVLIESVSLVTPELSS